MKISINYFDYVSFQQKLNDAFPDKFTVVVETNNNIPSLYIECDDNLDSAEIAQATTMANDFNLETVEKHRAGLIKHIDGKALKIIAAQQFADSIDQDAQLATEWKADTTKQCPFAVMFYATKMSVSNQAAADMIISEKQRRDNFLNSVKTITEPGKMKLFNCSNLIELKNSASLTIQSLKDLVSDNN